MDSQISPEFAFIRGFLPFSLFVHPAPHTFGNYLERGQLKFDFLCTLGQRTCVALSKDRESMPSIIPLPLLKKSWPRMMSALVQLVPPLLKK